MKEAIFENLIRSKVWWSPYWWAVLRRPVDRRTLCTRSTNELLSCQPRIQLSCSEACCKLQWIELWSWTSNQLYKFHSEIDSKASFGHSCPLGRSTFCNSNNRLLFLWNSECLLCQGLRTLSRLLRSHGTLRWGSIWSAVDNGSGNQL